MIAFFIAGNQISSGLVRLCSYQPTVRNMKLRGHLVEVRARKRSWSLDKNGRLQNSPSCPDAQYYGQRFKPSGRTRRTPSIIAGRRLADSVHLGLRWDGEAYGGCQAACLLFGRRRASNH